MEVNGRQGDHIHALGYEMAMDLLAAFRTFVRIAETGSFSAVAREVGATQPAISRQVAALEAHLGARLVQRSTRSLTLTEDGRDLLAHARQVLETVEQAEAAIGRQRSTPAGLVRLGCPAVFGRLYIAPRIGALLARYPQLSVELVLTDDVVDMVQERLDLAVRVGPISDASLVARRVGSTTSIVVAAPDYIEQHGEPKHPSELDHHECVLFTRMADQQAWIFAGKDEEVPVHVSGRLRADGIEAVMEAVVSGFGIGLLPTWMIRDSVRTGRLRELLRDWQPPRRPISVVYPSRRFLPPRTRAMIDFIVDEFRLDPIISAYGVG
jgi:DNA-binding transcriptional LysR family regulator